MWRGLKLRSKRRAAASNLNWARNLIMPIGAAKPIARMNQLGPVSHPRILGIGTANPSVRLTQEQSFHAAGYQGERIRKIFLNSKIDYRHFYLEGALNREESSDQLNQRYLRGAMKTGCRAILNCVRAAGTTVQDVDFLAVCTCTGYVCPDVGSRLIAHMGFRINVQRVSIVGARYEFEVVQ